MLVSYDPEAGATYVEFSDAEVATTHSVTDLVMVDFDADHQVVGVEFAVPPAAITEDMLHLLADYHPLAFKPLFGDRSWLLTRA